MPLNTVALPTSWDLPNVPGIPALSSPLIEHIQNTSAAATIADSAVPSDASSQWGIYDSSGTLVLSAAHVMAIDYEVGYQVSDAPIEDGAFVSYNKVQRPFTARVLMICDGSEIGASSSDLAGMTTVGDTSGAASMLVRANFLKTLEGIVADLNLYTVVTPERSYKNANIVAYRFRRSTQNGVTMPQVEIALQEIRLTSTTAFQNQNRSQNTAQPQGQKAVAKGAVQPTPVDPALVKTAIDLQSSGY